MGRIVVTEFISLDGVVEAPGGEDFKYPNWSFEFDRGKEGAQFKIDEALGAEALLLGRRTCEGFAAAWPQYEGNSIKEPASLPRRPRHDRARACCRDAWRRLGPARRRPPLPGLVGGRRHVEHHGVVGVIGEHTVLVGGVCGVGPYAR
jgi:hypothetical protein